MADYNAVMAQLQQQAQQAAQDRMAALLATGQYIPLEDGSLWDVAREQAVTKDQVLGDALVPAMQQYVQANPGDPAAQQMQRDLTDMQAAAQKGDFGSLLHGLAVSAAAGGAMSGAFGGGSILGGLPPAGGEMLGEGVFGPPAPGGSYFVGPPSPGVDGFIPGPAAPTPILGEGLMGPPAPGGDFFTGPPTPAGTPTGTGMPAPNYPMPAPTAPPAPSPVPAPTGSGVAPVGATGAIASKLNEMFGINLTDSDLSLLGKLGGAGLGLLGANAQTDALKGVLDQQRAERAPALSAFNNMLTNPGSWYNSAPALGASEAALRRLNLSGNPAQSASDISKLAAYNLGGYTGQLGVLGNLGLSGQNTTAQLGTQLAQSGQTPYNIGANLLGQLTTPQQNPFEQWMAAATKYGKLDGSGAA